MTSGVKATRSILDVVQTYPCMLVFSFLRSIHWTVGPSHTQTQIHTEKHKVGTFTCTNYNYVHKFPYTPFLYH